MRLRELWTRKQSDLVKQAVAWWVKSGSAVDDAWISTKLEMRSRANIQRAMRHFRTAHDAKTEAIRRQLTICAD